MTEVRPGQGKLLNVMPGWVNLLQNPAAGNGVTEPGDSGGPVFWIEPDGTRVVVGVGSFNHGMGQATSLYWRMDLPETLDFIAQVIQGLEP